VAEVFHSYQECTLKDNSLDYLNNSWEFAIRQIEGANSASATAIGKDSQDELIKNHHFLGANFKFTYLEARESASSKKEQMRQIQKLMLHVHNVDSFLRLDYFRQFPLDLVLTDAALLKYNRIFFTLVKVKQVLSMLKQCWKWLNSTNFRRLRSPSELKKIRLIQLLRQQMQAILSSFEEYIKVDAIEALWLGFKSRLAAVQVFEDLMKLHSEFLDKVLDKTLHGRMETKIAQFICKILLSVQKLCASVRLYDTELVTCLDPQILEE